jgi:hypothetical protein
MISMLRYPTLRYLGKESARDPYHMVIISARLKRDLLLHIPRESPQPFPPKKYGICLP